MMMMNSNGGSRGFRSPFTATQWQELEHQALIFKYMVSGVPIPPDLIYNVKRSLESSRLFPHQPIGWGCFQMGFGRKVDPEPGRCRRTDGKKWRCSKEAYPDSKYCERHMHRGRNRSRKPVESQNPSNPIAKTPTQSINSSSSSFINSHSDSSSRPSGSVSFSQNSSTQNLFLGSGSSSSSQTDHKDYRYVHGMMREGLDEQALFPEASGTVRSLLPAADSYTNYKNFSQTQFQNLSTNNPNQEQEHDQQQQQQQHCFVLGTDFKSATTRPIKLEKESESMKPLHHFFGDWTPKNTDSWLDLASNSGLHADG